MQYKTKNEKDEMKTVIRGDVGLRKRFIVRSILLATSALGMVSGSSMALAQPGETALE
jgi:hypothetical protein